MSTVVRTDSGFIALLSQICHKYGTDISHPGRFYLRTEQSLQVSCILAFSLQVRREQNRPGAALIHTESRKSGKSSSPPEDDYAAPMETAL
jgi:hypothetical protein